MEMSKILQLIDAVNDSELTELSLEEGGEKLTLKRAGEPLGEVSYKNTSGRRRPTVQRGEEHFRMEEENEKLSGKDIDAPGEKTEGECITSPMVGTFYSSPSEEEAPYVKVGDCVKKGQVLGIIETMKLMNEITSDRDGVIAEVLVENEQVVEYGQGLFRIQ